MIRAFTLAFGLVLCTVFVACSDDGESVLSTPEELTGAGKGVCTLTDEIADVFSHGGLRNAVTKQCSNIAGELADGDTEGAVEKVFSLIDKILGHHADGETTGDNEAVGTLLNELLALVLLEGIFPTEVDENTGGGTCDNGGCTIVNQSGIAGISVPPQTDLGMCYISFTLREFDPELFSGFDNYPFQFEYEIVCADEATGGLDLAQNGTIFEPAAIVGLCFADPPLGPTTEDVPNENRQLAHLPDGEEVPELLPVEVADFLSDEDCAEASEVEETSLPFRALAKLEPISEFFVSPLWANPGRLGGAISAFSPIGPVDNRGQEVDGGISGTVFSNCNETGINGAQVELFTNDEELVDTTFTGNNGDYSFTEVPPGDYFVQASAETYDSATEDASVASGETTTGVNVGLTPTLGCID
jgi:hypothetical protein